MWSVFVDLDYNKRGQTSRPVVGAQIQTCCNFEANVRDRYYLLGCAHCFIIVLPLKFPYSWFVYNYSCFTVFSNLDLLLHNDFFQTPSSSNHITRPSSTTEPNKSTEHSAIQKSSVHCTVVAIDVSRLLSTLWYSDGSITYSYWIILCSSRCAIYSHITFRKLVIKPDSLLLEDKRSETSSEGHNQTSTLLFIKLAFADFLLSFSLKGQCHGVFPAIFNKAGLKPWLSAIAHTRNAPRTSREIKKSREIFKKSGNVVHFKLLSSCKNGKTWKVPSELFKFRAWVPVVSVMGITSLHRHCSLIKMDHFL